MQKVFDNPAQLEKQAKEKYSIPPFLMMENAAKAMADFIKNLPIFPCHVVILCGKGNNGADGYALARLLNQTCNITIIATDAPSSEECTIQQQLAEKLGVNAIPFTNSITNADIIVDCIYGTGFHGELPQNARTILDWANNMNAMKIACDIPSGLYFNADITITMGEQKLVLYSDKAKSVCGKIIVANLGIDRTALENVAEPSAYLVEENDLKLPLRKKRIAHKGTYGHTVVFAGEKSGAGIIAATAAMHFGSGLTTLIKTENSNLEQFKISPELMISNTLPKKTTAILAGPGLGELTDNLITTIANANVPVVLDADALSSPKITQLLDKLTNQKVVLTPHLAELVRLLSSIDNKNTLDVTMLSESAENRITAGKIITQKYPNVTVVMKSANTFISSGDNTYIITDGCQSLAKGGSGDVLAGMITALLAQGYSTCDAAITASEEHALAAQKFGEEAYNLTPFELISII